MGWDAFATRNLDRRPKLSTRDKRLIKLASKVAFKKAKNRVDGLFADGVGLDCSASGKYLSEITGFDVYDERGWNADFVKALNERAHETEHSEDDAWAYHSAREFLKVCADNGLSIYFSW